MNRWTLFLIAILVVGSAWIWQSRVPVDYVPASKDPQPAVGHPAPDFTLPTLDGAEFTLSALRGTPVVLNFWATWCGPCRAEMPELQSASERYEPRIRIIGVDQGESPEVVQAFMDELGVTFTVPLDADMEIGNRYRIIGMPTTFFIDKEGIVRQIWAGEMNGIILAEGIAGILP